MEFTEKDTYKTIAVASEEVLFKEKNSKFFGYAFPVTSEEEVKKILEHLRKEHFSARHWCYAYQIGTEKIQYRANDDGEPNNSAGMPIYGQIQSFEVTNVLVVVVRYFGGVKLGTGPLGVAYKTAIGEALDEAEKEEKIVTAQFRVSVPYTDADVAMRFIKDLGAEIIQRDYDAQGTILTIDVRLDDEQALRDKLSKILSLRFPDDPKK